MLMACLSAGDQGRSPREGGGENPESSMNKIRSFTMRSRWAYHNVALANRVPLSGELHIIGETNAVWNSCSLLPK